MKSNKSIGLFFTICSVWLALAFVSPSRNIEFESVTDSIRNVEKLGNCTLSIEIERNWPFSWRYRAATLNVEHLKNKLKTELTMFDKPDRLYLGSGKTEYSYTNFDSDSGKQLVNKLDVVLSDDGKLKSLKVAICSDFPAGKSYYNNRNFCNVATERYECRSVAQSKT